MKRKRLPVWLKNDTLIEFFQSRPGRILSNWAMQGMLYMNSVEIAFKLILNGLLAFALHALFFEHVSVTSVGITIFLSHTINWIINCQPVALLMHIDIGASTPEEFISYIEGLEKRIKGKSFAVGVAAYGSLSLGNYKPTSDIDIRLMFKPDPVSRWRAALYCFIERVRAFIFWFPLDLYAFSMEEIDEKMSPKEPPILFDDQEGVLKAHYGEIISFSDFREKFYDINVRSPK